MKTKFNDDNVSMMTLIVSILIGVVSTLFYWFPSAFEINALASALHDTSVKSGLMFIFYLFPGPLLTIVGSYALILYIVKIVEKLKFSKVIKEIELREFIKEVRNG